MDKFIVSARKYRPQNFSAVVGQNHITTTLKNAIKNNQLAHAFLFCGPRGVGKTTCARILAKTINCENITLDGEACNNCRSCTSFNEGASLNVHELDAASNNSVDDIRALVEQVRFAPQAGRYKVYIIDEVHMLSSSAFNAFLKTLEEPPPYAIFILATTEKHKILPTILSRCQIFDFKRITTNDTANYLQEICTKESIRTEPSALQLIAQKSEGCMRDALSILDKIVSFTNSEVSYQNTLEHLNILDAEYYFRMVQRMSEQDIADVLLLFDDIMYKGFEGDMVLNGFLEFFRNLLVCKDKKAASLLEVVENFRDKYFQTAEKTPVAYIISALNILNETEINYKAARNKKLHVELALIKLCYLQQALEISAGDTGVTKKKSVESAIPLTLRNIPVLEWKKKGEGSRTTKQAAPQNEGPYQGGQGGARLIIETEEERQPAAKNPQPVAAKPVQPSAVAPTPSPAETPKAAEMPTTKLGALSKIRKQFAQVNDTATGTMKPLTIEALQAAWADFANSLREAKNPAVQSFERAELKVIDDSLFEIVSHNNLEQKFIDQQRMRLCEYLQALFNNKAVTYRMSLHDKISMPVITDVQLNSKEQFQKIVEQYPLVKELKDRLKLDLDY
ncbi:MAG: DNA polymerase III subunit gamma/tau [Williamsia sp.]|nr:DNA polymerase III subunit gamma/tau [Williamsia sp.]